jgi:plasmid stabilization system protein ParE
MAYRVETTARAERDADNLLSRLIAQQAGETGLRWFEGLEKAITTLADMPERCSLAPENTHVPFEVRQLLYGRKPHIYRILFTIEGDTVYVLHIRHGRRRPLTRLLPP